MQHKHNSDLEITTEIITKMRKHSPSRAWEIEIGIGIGQTQRELHTAPSWQLGFSKLMRVLLFPLPQPHSTKSPFFMFNGPLQPKKWACCAQTTNKPRHPENSPSSRKHDPARAASCLLFGSSLLFASGQSGWPNPKIQLLLGDKAKTACVWVFTSSEAVRVRAMGIRTQVDMGTQHTKISIIHSKS
jgi:hypothetical protein